MNPQSFLELIESLGKDWANSTHRPGPNRLDIELNPNRLIDAVTAISTAGDTYLIAITGMDPGVETGQLWVLYHFAQRDEVVTLRVILPRENPALTTITHELPAAAIFEQELGEVLGVTFIETGTGMPVYHDHLFLADDWPEGVYPLRKDFQAVN